MSIEEKAKAYDEALKWMRELYPRFPSAFKEEVEHYFPELRESEDERIRERILQLVSGDISQDDITDYENRQMRDWLEKHKEQKSTWSEEDETIIEGACSALEIYGHTKLASRLKSLRPGWKPTEEQMRALFDTTNPYFLPGDGTRKILNSLYEQLKKL